MARLKSAGVSFGHGTGNAFLDGLRRAVDQVLGFLEAQAGQLTNRLEIGRAHV